MSTALSHSEHGALPLPPIEKPHGLFVRLLYAITRRRYGKTPTAFRVLYARAPGVAFASVVIATVLDYFLTLDKELRFLLQVHGAMHTHCTFCADLGLAEATRNRIGRERFVSLLDFEGSARFSAREQAALRYAAALQRSLHIDDQVWAELSRHFSERERVEIVWVCAVERYFNAMALPLRIGSDQLSEPPHHELARAAR